MGFLSPALLALGLAVAVPIILHLFQRHQGPRLVFPALRYLRRAEKESARQIRLRQLLLMLLRITAVVLLALAAARPFARSGGAGHEPTAVAIVLDNSMSTGAVIGERRVLDDLKDRALATLENAGPDDRFWLLRAGAPWEPALPGDPAATAARVRQTEPTAAAADLSAAVAHARALLAAGAEGRASEIHLLTDLQASNIRDAADGPGGGSGERVAVLVWTPTGDAPPNVAVSDVEIGAGLTPTTGQRTNVVATATGERDTDSVRLRLSLDGRIVAAGVAPLGAAAVLPLPGRPAGLYRGWVETDPDALRGDDRRFFTLRVVPPPAAAIVGDLPFVEEAITALEEAGRVRRAPLALADVAFLEAGEGLESVPDGRTAIVLPPDSVLELPALNRRLGAAGMPWRFEAGTAGGEWRFQVDEAADELMQPLDRVRLTQVYALRRQGGAAAGDTVLLRLRDGAEWAVRGERIRGGRYILLASPLSAEATTVPTTAAMVPLLDRLVGAWAAAAPARADFAAGDVVPLPEAATAVEWPDGRVERAGGEFRAGAEPGVYRVLAGDSAVAAFAVNAAPAESDLRRFPAARLGDALSTTVETANDAEEWRREIYRNRLGRELWRPALLLALLVLTIEAAVAATGRARRDRESAERAAGMSRPAPLTAATAEHD
jgi:hypothetical protein